MLILKFNFLKTYINISFNQQVYKPHYVKNVEKHKLPSLTITVSLYVWYTYTVSVFANTYTCITQIRELYSWTGGV